jgi:hypothetical protein
LLEDPARRIGLFVASGRLVAAFCCFFAKRLCFFLVFSAPLFGSRNIWLLRFSTPQRFVHKDFAMRRALFALILSVAAASAAHAQDAAPAAGASAPAHRHAPHRAAKARVATPVATVGDNDSAEEANKARAILAGYYDEAAAEQDQRRDEAAKRSRFSVFGCNCTVHD